MITFTQGNLLEARAEALVNTVNTVGVMGKGIALMSSRRPCRLHHLGKKIGRHPNIRVSLTIA